MKPAQTQMSLSQAIRLGAMLSGPRVGRIGSAGSGTCALGAAALALGVDGLDAYHAVAEAWPDERGSLIASLGTETFGRWLGALAQHLTFDTEAQRAFIVKPNNLPQYDDFDKAVDWLFELGVRA